MEHKKKKSCFDHEKLQKGQILIVKVPPFFDKEYRYEIVGAGEKVIRANLFHSPKVKKQWTIDELEILFEHQLIRFEIAGKEPDHANNSTENSSD